MAKQDSGSITVEGDVLVWRDGEEVIISDTVVVGEYTTSDGPWFDDWFLVLVMKDGSWHSISQYAKNIEAVIAYLNKKFQADIVACSLVSSTSWNSVVLYPAHLKGKPLFNLPFVLANEIEQFIQNNKA